MIDHNLILRTVIFEQQLQIFKTNFYHLRKLEFEAELSKLKYSKQNHYVIKELKNSVEECEKAIRRSEKYNNEVTAEFILKCPNKTMIKEYIDNTTDLYIDFTNQLVKSLHDASPTNPVNLRAGLLKADDKGNIQIEGKKYSLIF